MIKRTNAMEASNNYKANNSNKSAREQNKKQVQNLSRKTASDVSKENKVSFTATSDYERTESTNEKETIRLNNPNVGRTVNYNFFQLQNIYKTETRLIDVKILVDPGIELIAGSGISDKKIYDIEEFNKIYFHMYKTPAADNDKLSVDDEDRNAYIATIVARQVIKNYFNLEQDVLQIKGRKKAFGLKHLDEGNGALEWIEMFQYIKKFKKPQIQGIVKVGDDQTNLKDNTTDLEEKIIILKDLVDIQSSPDLDTLKSDLNTLKSMEFRFSNKRIPVTAEETHAVNTGSFHMDAQVGLQSATESYLEQHRKLEIERLQAEVEHLKAQTKAGVFYPPYALPSEDIKEIAKVTSDSSEE